jgi:4-hydroxybenzoate polyprenyltransferase
VKTRLKQFEGPNVTHQRWLQRMFTDIKENNRLIRCIPQEARPYARLLRLDRPIGTWLLLIPCWWGVALACMGVPDPIRIILFAIGAIVMRGAGCIVNDIYDRKIDAAVERTKTRPLASGEVKLWQAIVFLSCLLLLGLGILLLFNPFTIKLGALSLLLVVIYPVMKRITDWPQLFLGFTFNWGALMGWASVTTFIGWPVVWLYIAGIFWTLGYDTIYAHQDKRDDLLVGIKSTALLFGDRSRIWVAGFYAATIGFLALSGWSAALGKGFFIGLAVAAVFAAIELGKWRMDDPANCLLRFRRNRDFGLIVLLGIIAGQFF